MATQSRKDAVLHPDGSWSYLPMTYSGNGMIVSAETPAWEIINFVGMERATAFMEEYFTPMQYRHVFTYSFSVDTALDDARDIAQIEKHRALLLKIEKDLFSDMQASITHSTSEKLL